MKISYAITVCNELEELTRLVEWLTERKRPQDEIVVLMDNSTMNPVYQFLVEQQQADTLKYFTAFLNNDFAAFKNKLMDKCTGDYIFQIDADEIPHQKLIEILPDILEENIECDVIMVPRVNTVVGITQEHIQRWGWNVNGSGWVNWPDYQWRIWKNKSEIKWINKVHERLDGFTSYSMLPADTEAFSLYHPKTIDRQVKQNEYYESL